jgi:hypothetical protein
LTDSPEARLLYKACPGAFWKWSLVDGQIVPNPITSVELKFEIAKLKALRRIITNTQSKPCEHANGPFPKSTAGIDGNNRRHPSVRQKVIREHIQCVADFKDSAKLTGLFGALDAARVTLPKRRGVGPRSGLWSKLTKAMQRIVVEDLRRDFYRAKRSLAQEKVTTQ